MSSSLVLGGAKAGLGVVLQAVWMAGFGGLSGLGRLRGARGVAREWASLGGDRVLVIAPHADDEAIGCGGTLLRHQASGDTACIVYVTDGGRSRALGLGRDEMVRRRAEEARQAAAALKVARVVALGLPEGEWSQPELAARLVDLIADWAPRIIYAPSRIDFHPDHRRVAAALADALSLLAGDLRIRIYQVQVPLTGLLANLITPIVGVLPDHAAALAAYQTQRGSTARTARMRRYAAAWHGYPGAVEAFWELAPAEFCALHSGDAAAWPEFRGLRPHPASDPLAYLVGRAARRRARRQALDRQPAAIS